MKPDIPGGRPLKVALVGLRHLHPRSYLPLFAQVAGVKVAAVVEADRPLRDAVAAEFGLAGYSKIGEMLEREKPDIAAIFLPHAECPGAAVRCLEWGAHVMVEKPMAATAEGAGLIVAAARRTGLALTTGYCWRFHPVAREIRRLVAGGAIGRVIGGDGRCAAGRLDRYLEGGCSWMLERAVSGGGPLFNLGVHWIDLFRWILQDEVTEVSGRNVKVNAQFDVEDNCHAHLQFSGGAVVALDISYTVPDRFPNGRDLYVALRGTRGVLSWAPAYEGETDVLHICSDDPSLSGAPVRQIEFRLEAVKGYSGYMGREYVRTFVEAVREGGKPPITGDDAVAALRVAEAFYRAAGEKKWVGVGS